MSKKYGSNATSFTKEAHSLNSNGIIPKNENLDKESKNQEKPSEFDGTVKENGKLEQYKE